MVAQRTGFGVGPLPKKTIANTSKHIKVPRKTTTSFGKKGEIVDGKSSGKVDENPAQETPGAEDTLLQKKEISVEKENGQAATPLIKPAIAKPKKFRFWCEICHVGAFSQNVMNAHQRGKKHLAQLNQNKEPTLEIKSAQNGAAQAKKEPEVATEEKKEPEEAAEEKKEPEEAAEEKKEPEVAAEEKKEPEVAVDENKEQEVAVEENKEQEVAAEEKKEPEVAVEEKKEPEMAAVKKKEIEVAALKEKEPQVAIEEMKEPDVAAVEEMKKPDVVTVEIKQETVVEQVESKEGSADNNVPGTEDKDEVIENAGYVITERDTNQVPPSNEGDC